MVPYIGVVFILPALLTGGFSYFRARRRNGPKRKRKAYMHRGELVLSIQLVLWWLLYLIPEIGI